MSIELTIEDDLWLKQYSQSDWQLLFDDILARATSLQHPQINVILTNDQEIQNINRQFRNIDKPTNVLSFPLYSKEEIKTLSPEEKLLLGDVILAYNTIQEEASMFGRTLHDRVAHLFVHGTLHVLGYDHATENERLEMESLEIEILSFFQIDNPYILRSNT